MNIMEYTPCRLVNTYKENQYDDTVIILTFNGLITLKDVGKQVWILSNGKNSIESIINEIIKVHPNFVFDDVKLGVLKLIKQLKEKNILIANWNPILKNEISQNVE